MKSRVAKSQTQRWGDKGAGVEVIVNILVIQTILVEIKVNDVIK